MKKHPWAPAAGGEDSSQGDEDTVPCRANPRTALASYLDELLSPAAPPPAAPPRHEPLVCRLFEAGGVVLAAPASLLSLVPCVPLRPADRSVPRWIAGLGEYQGMTRVVVDLAALIGEEPVLRPEQEPAGALLLLDSTRIALRPQRLLATAVLDPARICWRSANTRRAWLMGVCADPPCALLDVEALAAAAVTAAGMDSAISRSGQTQRQ